MTSVSLTKIAWKGAFHVVKKKGVDISKIMVVVCAYYSNQAPKV